MKKRVDNNICASCKYRGFFQQRICCNYLGVTGKSRIFEDGKLRHDPRYCEHYEKGAQNITDAWTSDSMTLWAEDDEKRRQFRKEFDL